MRLSVFLSFVLALAVVANARMGFRNPANRQHFNAWVASHPAPSPPLATRAFCGNLPTPQEQGNCMSLLLGFVFDPANAGQRMPNSDDKDYIFDAIAASEEGTSSDLAVFANQQLATGALTQGDVNAYLDAQLFPYVESDWAYMTTFTSTAANACQIPAFQLIGLSAAEEFTYAALAFDEGDNGVDNRYRCLEFGATLPALRNKPIVVCAAKTLAIGPSLEPPGLYLYIGYEMFQFIYNTTVGVYKEAAYYEIGTLQAQMNSSVGAIGYGTGYNQFIPGMGQLYQGTPPTGCSCPVGTAWQCCAGPDALNADGVVDEDYFLGQITL